MPAYTYECETCEDVFDVRRSMTDDSPVVCTTCAGSRVRQVYFAPAMVGRVFGEPGAGGERRVHEWRRRGLRKLLRVSLADTSSYVEAPEA